MPWRKERLYGERDTVLWAILEGQRVIGSALVEADADAIIADHESAPILRTALEALNKSSDALDNEIQEFGKPVSSEIYGWWQQAQLDADKVLS